MTVIVKRELFQDQKLSFALHEAATWIAANLKDEGFHIDGVDVQYDHTAEGKEWAVMVFWR